MTDAQISSIYHTCPSGLYISNKFLIQIRQKQKSKATKFNRHLIYNYLKQKLAAKPQI